MIVRYIKKFIHCFFSCFFEDLIYEPVLLAEYDPANKKNEEDELYFFDKQLVQPLQIKH